MRDLRPELVDVGHGFHGSARAGQHVAGKLDISRGQLGNAQRTFRSRTVRHLALGYYRTSSPVAARPMINRWISEVPSKIVKILASRCQRSTGYSRV